MGRKMLTFGGIYLAYEIVSSAILLAFAAYGFNLSGF